MSTCITILGGENFHIYRDALDNMVYVEIDRDSTLITTCIATLEEWQSIYPAPAPQVLRAEGVADMGEIGPAPFKAFKLDESHPPLYFTKQTPDTVAFEVGEVVSPEYKNNAQTLAGLVTAYLTETGLRPTTPPLAIQQMLELAAKLKGE